MVTSLERCPACGKPVKAKSGVCPWCKGPLGSADDDASAGDGGELEQLKRWMAAGPPPEPLTPVLSTSTLIFLSLVVVPFSTGLFCGRVLEIQTVLVGLLAFVSVLMLIPAVYQLLKDVHASPYRRRRTADGVAWFFAGCLRGRRFRWIAHAVAPYQEREKRDLAGRGDSLHSFWSERIGHFSGRVTAVTVDSLEELSDGMAALTVMVTISWPDRHGGPGGPQEMLTMERLAVRRGDRWYLVNGLERDRVDRRLIAALRLQAGSSGPTDRPLS